MILVDCIICDALFESVRGDSKYCKTCAAKQRQARTREIAKRNKKFSRVPIRRVKPITINCPVCKQVFTTMLRAHGPQKTYCSVKCRKIMDNCVATGLASNNPRRRRKKPPTGSDAVLVGAQKLAGQIK